MCLRHTLWPRPRDSSSGPPDGIRAVEAEEQARECLFLAGEVPLAEHKGICLGLGVGREARSFEHYFKFIL